MKAIVFAAGVGSRLKPFTDSHPKALVPVAGIPMLGRVIGKLKNAGVSEIVVNIHHFPSQIRHYLEENNNFGIDIEISDESDLLLDTGGALARIYRESRIIANAGDNEPVIVHNADILADFELTGLTETLAGSEAAILVDPHRQSTRRFLFDSDGKLAGWTNLTNGKVRPEDLDLSGMTMAAFGGIHAMTRSTLADISDYCGQNISPFSIVDFYLDVCREKAVRAFTPSVPYNWFDIGTSEKLAVAEAWACASGLKA
ncbi:MAG: NTP transferase domain-containing protein [Muribaculaceae bacterium]|nr:NTP transferase domain-containing protein [Muribaculaceae bacterium]MDE6134910.1 NTP transferase domain-containing protein [Muribaculaceae bacterium]